MEHTDECLCHVFSHHSVIYYQWKSFRFSVQLQYNCRLSVCAFLVLCGKRINACISFIQSVILLIRCLVLSSSSSSFQFSFLFRHFFSLSLVFFTSDNSLPYLWIRFFFSFSSQRKKKSCSFLQTFLNKRREEQLVLNSGFSAYLSLHTGKLCDGMLPDYVNL